MSASNPHSRRLDSHAWRQLEGVIERFEQAWEQGERPELHAYLPDDPDLRRALLVELAHADLEYRLRAGETARVEDYLHQHPELRDDQATALELIASEYRARTQQQGAPALDEYFQRFPEHVAELRARLQERTGFAPTPTPPSLGCTRDDPRATWPHTPEGAAPPAEPKPRIRLREPPDQPGPSLPAPPATLPSHAGRCALVGELARGGMGVVLKGHDPELGRDVAVKVLLDRYNDQLDVIGRFLMEAQVSGQLQHPGIVPVYDVGRLAGQRPYFTMKLVQGQTLAALLAERPDPGHDLPRFLKVFEQVCQTLAYAHSRGVIHRDLKPSNIMVGAFGEVQVMDWGLAKILPPADGPRPRADAPVGLATQPGFVVGTPAYMAPEQARGEVQHLDERCDVFGLGAILCEILTGRPPYVGRSSLEVFRQAEEGLLQDTLGRLDACGAEGDLLRLARACLAASAADRPRDAGVVAQDMSAYLAGVQERLRAVEVERAAAQARAEEARAKVAAQRRAHRLTLGLAAAVLLTAAVGTAAGLWIKQERDERAAEAARQLAESQRQASETKSGVEAALQEAARLRAIGHQQTSDPVRWAGTLAVARSAVQRADGVLASGAATDELRQQLRAARAALDEDEKDRRMVERLEDVIVDLQTGNFGQVNHRRTDAQFAQAFREYGIDVDRLAAQDAADRLRARPIRRELAVAIDLWSVTRSPELAAPRTWQHLTAVARRADPDPWRNQLRDTLARPDLAGLDDLAARVNVAQTPSATVVLLADLLFLRHRAGDLEKAVSVLQRAQALHPTDFVLACRLAGCFARQQPQDWDEQVRYYTVAVSLRPRSDVAHCALGVALAGRGQMADGLAAVRRAVALDGKSARNHAILGLIQRVKGDLAGAADSFRTAVQLEPGRAAYWSDLAMMQAELGRRREALEAFDKALELDPSRGQTHFNLGFAWKRWEGPAKALPHFRKAVACDPKLPRGHLFLGHCLDAVGKPDEADAAYREGIAQLPEDADLRIHYGTFLRSKYGDDDALAQFEAALERDPGRWEANYQKGLILRQRKDLPGAAAALQRAVAANPRFPGGHFHLGTLLAEQGKVKEGIAELRTAHKLDPKQALTLCNLGRLLIQVRQFDEAVHVLRQAKVLAPDLPEAQRQLGFALELANRHKEAVPFLKDVVRREPKNVTAQALLGSALANSGQLDAALVHLRQAIVLQPEDGRLEYNLGVVLQARCQFQEALAHFERAEQLAPRTRNSMPPPGPRIQECRRLLALDAELSAVIDGKRKLTRAEDLLRFADFCRAYKQHFATAARLYEEAFAAQPALAKDLKAGHRAHAAVAAAAAGCGRGKDVSSLDDPARARWRARARAWLQADCDCYAKLLSAETPPQARRRIQQVMESWRAEPGLAGLRDTEALARLPEREQEACRKLWDNVQEVLARARSPR
jgi:serine/threonine-protein kinase